MGRERNLKFGPAPAPLGIGAASPCQGEAKKKDPGSLRSADSGRDDTTRGRANAEIRVPSLRSG